MMKGAALLALVGGAYAMDTSSQPGEDLAVVTDTPTVHRVRCAVRLISAFLPAGAPGACTERCLTPRRDILLRSVT